VNKALGVLIVTLIEAVAFYLGVELWLSVSPLVGVLVWTEAVVLAPESQAARLNRAKMDRMLKTMNFLLIWLPLFRSGLFHIIAVEKTVL